MKKSLVAAVVLVASLVAASAAQAQTPDPSTVDAIIAQEQGRLSTSSARRRFPATVPSPRRSTGSSPRSAAGRSI